MTIFLRSSLASETNSGLCDFSISKPIAFLFCASAIALVVVSCGAQENEGGLCTVTLTREAATEIQSELRKVTLRGEFSSECKDLYTRQSGRSELKLNVTSLGNPGAYLSLLQAGDRSFPFNSSLSFATGSLETKFSSDTLKNWAFPWADKPGTAAITVLVPVTSEEKNWPTLATLELKATK